MEEPREKPQQVRSVEMLVDAFQTNIPSRYIIPKHRQPLVTPPPSSGEISESRKEAGRITEYEQLGSGELNLKRHNIFRPLVTVGLVGSRRTMNQGPSEPFVVEITRYDVGQDEVIDAYFLVDVSAPNNDTLSLGETGFMPEFQQELADLLGLKYSPPPESQ